MSAQALLFSRSHKQTFLLFMRWRADNSQFIEKKYTLWTSGVDVINFNITEKI